MAIIEKHPHIDGTMYNYDGLIKAIEQLEKDGIISFDEFEKLPYYEIKKQFFKMPQPTMMEKAKIIIRAKRDGNTGPLEYTTGTVYHEEGKPTKIKTITHRF